MDALSLHVLKAAAELTAVNPASDDEILAAATRDLARDSIHACAAALADLIAVGMVWGDPAARRAVQAARGLVADAVIPEWPPPVLHSTPQFPPDEVDKQGALHARESVGQVRDLLDDWSANPPGILRTGGLALRDFAAARQQLRSDWSRTALTIELAFAARLFADDRDSPPHWVPTDAFDIWLTETVAIQWIDLAQAWLALPRLASLADQRTQVLTADRDRGAIPVLRRKILELLASAPTGETINAASIRSVLDYREPRRAGELRALTIDSTLREATDLGVIAASALTTAGRLLLDASEQAVGDAFTRSMPPDIDRVIIQADLTIVAPGPLVPNVARSLRLIADIESRGHATVYRISEGSVRRALDSGWDAAAVHGLLADISSSPVPQPLTYLIDDVARKYGAVRTGPALGYLRSDNAETLAALLGDRRLRGLGLSRIAETVLVSQTPPGEVMDALRTAGYAPAAETPDGQVLIRRPDDRRTRAPRPAKVKTSRAPEAALVDAAVRSLRAGDAVGRRGASTPGPASMVELQGLGAAAIVTRLRAAIADTMPVVIGYADIDGETTQQIVDPIRVAGGVLTAYDRRDEQIRSFAVARMTGVADVESDDPA